MIIPALSLSLFLYASCMVRFATSFTSAMPGSASPRRCMLCSSTRFLTYAHTFWVSAACEEGGGEKEKKGGAVSF